jgi:hypothetical protein
LQLNLGVSPRCRDSTGDALSKGAFAEHQPDVEHEKSRASWGGANWAQTESRWPGVQSRMCSARPTASPATCVLKTTHMCIILIQILVLDVALWNGSKGCGRELVENLGVARLSPAFLCKQTGLCRRMRSMQCHTSDRFCFDPRILMRLVAGGDAANGEDGPTDRGHWRAHHAGAPGPRR